jgi:hypothetical protein
MSMKIIDLLNENVVEFGRIDEASLSRVLSMIRSKDFCIITAFRSSNSRKVNRQRNKNLFSDLRTQGLSGYSLIGHWQEASDGVDWRDASPEQLRDSVEDTILCIRPDSMSIEEFTDFIVSLTKKYNQDASIISIKGDGIFLYFKDGDRDFLGNQVTLNKISQAYSKLRSGNQTPFVFEGILQPTSNFGRMAFNANNILYIS